MKFKKGLTHNYEQLKYTNLSVDDVHIREYHAYIFDKTEELAERMEEIILDKGMITFDEIVNLFDKLDDGMSNYQHMVILQLLCDYWAYSEYIKKYKLYTEDMIDYDD